MGDDPVTRRHTTKQKDIEAGSRKSLSPTAIGFGILAMRKVFIGIDGGGTKTKAAVIDHNGNLIGEAVTGGSNWNSVGVDKSKIAVVGAITTALQAAGRNVDDVEGICLGMSGVDRPDDKQVVLAWMKEVLPKATASITNDAVVALASGTGGNLHGIVVISGTGTIALGYKNGEGPKRAQGWGSDRAMIADVGSGFDIGQRLLTAVAKAADARGPETTLTKLVLAHLKLDAPMDLIGWTYKDLSWDRFAGLSQLVFTAAKEGDAVAVSIIDEAVKGLLESILAVKKQLDFNEPLTVVFAGGNLTHEGSILASSLEASLKREIPDDVVVSLPKVEPVIGAALLAQKQMLQAL